MTDVYPFWPYNGYFNLGPVAIPPGAALFGLTDRTTGTVWYLAAGLSSGHLSYTDTPSGPQLNKNRTKVYNAFEEPVLGNSGIKIFANNGKIGIEVDTAWNGWPGPWVYDFSNANQIWKLDAMQFLPADIAAPNQPLNTNPHVIAIATLTH